MWTTIHQTLAEVNAISIFVRLLLAVVCSGIIGIDRGRKKRPAGLRTYMLVCLGSALVMITNQYIVETFHTGDPSRLGAQVISGIGFLGAGTIIVTQKTQVKGLTTAAGLWASACMGLAIGIGFYEGALIACLFIAMVMIVFHRMDTYMVARSKVLELYLEFEELTNISSFLNYLKTNGMRVSDVQIVKPRIAEENGIGAILTVRLPEVKDHSEVLEVLSSSAGLKYIEEL